MNVGLYREKEFDELRGTPRPAGDTRSRWSEKPSGVPTDRFVSLEGAFACLLEDFNVAGGSAKHDGQRPLPL
jgi:hypothetical protein